MELVEKVDSDAREVSRVRRSVATALDDWGICEDDQDVVTLLVSEVVTNAIRHGEPPVQLRAEHSDGVVLVEVEDAGRNDPVPVEATSWDVVSGRGLHLVESLSEAWGVIRNGASKRVWFRVAVTR